jgi:hypothetical protein
MSRKPKTKSEMPSEDDQTAIPDVGDRPTGRRWVSEEIAAVERELIEDGVELPNRGIPSRYRSRVLDCTDADELRALIETETEKEHPNQQLIGWINSRLAEVSDE